MKMTNTTLSVVALCSALLLSTGKGESESTARDAAQSLKLKLTLDKNVLDANDQLTARFDITNVSKRPVTFATRGGLYYAAWFSIWQPNSRVIKGAADVEIISTDLEETDLATIAPGKTLTRTINAKLSPSKENKSELILDFRDSHYRVKCGQSYQIKGLFLARADESGRFKLTSGTLSSPAQQLRIANCK